MEVSTDAELDLELQNLIDADISEEKPAENSYTRVITNSNKEEKVEEPEKSEKKTNVKNFM